MRPRARAHEGNAGGIELQFGRLAAQEGERRGRIVVIGLDLRVLLFERDDRDRVAFLVEAITRP